MYGYDEAWNHLTGRGFKLAGNFQWAPPQGLKINDADRRAVDYLFYNWDFGDFAPPPKTED